MKCRPLLFAFAAAAAAWRMSASSSATVLYGHCYSEPSPAQPSPVCTKALPGCCSRSAVLVPPQSLAGSLARSLPFWTVPSGLWSLVWGPESSTPDWTVPLRLGWAWTCTGDAA
ncbi:hypothetical protein GGI42DRAFT_261728 [Trichoderma sp. SZMC 28013]